MTRVCLGTGDVRKQWCGTKDKSTGGPCGPPFVIRAAVLRDDERNSRSISGEEMSGCSKFLYYEANSLTLAIDRRRRPKLFLPANNTIRPPSMHKTAEAGSGTGSAVT